MNKSRGHFNIVLRPEPEGRFTAIVPILPGCVTYDRIISLAATTSTTTRPRNVEQLFPIITASFQRALSCHCSGRRDSHEKH